MNIIILIILVLLLLIVFTTKKEYMTVLLQCEKDNKLYNCTETTNTNIQKKNFVERLNKLFSGITKSSYDSYSLLQKQYSNNENKYYNFKNTLN